MTTNSAGHRMATHFSRGLTVALVTLILVARPIRSTRILIDVWRDFRNDR